MSTWKIGDHIAWKINHKGRTRERTGQIVAIVPTLASPQPMMSAALELWPRARAAMIYRLGAVRDHESYLVLEPRGEGSSVLHWPRVAALYQPGDPASKGLADATLSDDDRDWLRGYVARQATIGGATRRSAHLALRHNRPGSRASEADVAAFLRAEGALKPRADYAVALPGTRSRHPAAIEAAREAARARGRELRCGARLSLDGESS